MPLSEEKKSRLDEISASSNDKKIIASLKQAIESETLKAEDVFSYTDYYYEKNKSKRYALSEKVINQFGIFVGQKGKRKLKEKLYKLAAERGSSYGNENYAKCLLLKKNYAEALPFAQQAVELTKNSATEKHQHKFTLWKLLIENKHYSDSYDVLRAYVESISLANAEEKVYQKSIEELKVELDAFMGSDDGSQDSPKIIYIDQLIYLIDHSQHLRGKSVFYALKQELYFLKGQYAEKLSDTEGAWRAYCDVYDTTSSVYQRAVVAKVQLLKDKIRALLISLPAIGQIALAEEEKPADELEMLSSPVKLKGACRKESAWFDSMNKEKIELRYQQRLTKIEEERKKINEEQSVIEEQLDLIEDNIQEQRKKHLPEYRKMHRRYLAETHFFNPLRTKKQPALIALIDSIIEQRYQINTAPAPIDLTGKSSRLLITAERIYQEAVIALNGQYSPNLGIPRAREKSWNFNGYSGGTGYGPVEKYQVGTSVTQSEHRTSPKRNRLGDSFLPQYGAYSKDIYPFLNKVCNKSRDKEKSLASWMIRYGKSHQSVSIAELQTIYPAATQADINSLNHICFLIMEKEQMQWHSAVAHQYFLGMSVAQARALILIKEGYLCFEEVFKNEVFFGVYSQKGLLDYPERVEDACEHIEEMYTAYLQTKYTAEHLSFFKRNLKDKVHLTSVLTREQAHQDLKAVYGGESDTENEGYESDLSFS